MDNKNKQIYYPLDDIGFVGTQHKKTKPEQKKDILKTGEIIRKEKQAVNKKASLARTASSVLPA